MKKIKIVDLFAGVGGLSYGFAHDEFFEIVAANEILPNMAKAYELNHPFVKMYNRDIKDFGISDLSQDLGIKKKGHRFGDWGSAMPSIFNSWQKIGR